VLKSTRAPADIAPGWTPGTARELTRCLRRSYRLELMAAGQPCLLWVSGRDRPGVHGLGVLTGGAEPQDGTWAVALRLTLLTQPVLRTVLLHDPVASQAEVLRMPAGSNPSWLSPTQFAAVLTRVQHDGLGAWRP
jgi:hypothetical protein